MNSTTAVLDRVVSDLDLLLRNDQLAGLTDADRLEVLSRAGAVLRRVEAVVVETTATAEPEFPHDAGCRNMNELLQRALVTDAPSAGRVVRASRAVRRDVNLVSGERMPARWPALRDAMLDGALGVAGLLAATVPVDQAGDRISPDDRLRADAELADFARGTSTFADRADGDDGDVVTDDLGADPKPDGGDTVAAGSVSGPPATPEDLKQFALLLAMYLDPDGAEPSDAKAAQGRFLSIGRARNGSHPVRGNLLPEVAAQLQLIIDAFNNPKVGGAPAPGVTFTDTDSDTIEGTENEDPFNADPRNVIDSRTPAQKRHDALAAALGIAARHHEMPTLAGAAPTLVVHIDINDLARHTGATSSFVGTDGSGTGAPGAGWATLPDGTSIPAGAAAHVGCAGTIQRVLFDEGRIVGISTTDRVFTIHQRRAIIARDRECLIPGCHVPASWCEIHHVTEHARGGPTRTDNGVPLCWWHHRSLDRSGWEIRMAGGLPQIRGPAWWDPAQHWRTPRLSSPLTRATRRVPSRT